MNYGTISASGGIGVSTVGSSSVLNYGTISAGTGIQAILVRPLNIVNFGTIIGTGGPAIQLTSAADTLTLMPTSTIIGAINLGGGSDAINLRGNHDLTFDSVSGAKLMGTPLLAVSNNRVVAVDATPFTATLNLLNDYTGTIASTMLSPDSDFAPGGREHIAEASPLAFASNYAEAAVAGSAIAKGLAFSSPTTAVYADGITVSSRGFAGRRVQQDDDNAIRGNVSSYYGSALSIEKSVPDLRLGAFVGGLATHTNVDLSAGSVDGETLFGGFYFKHSSGASFLNGLLQGGVFHNSTFRNISNNTVVGGRETAAGTYRGWYLQPVATIGNRLLLGELFGAQHALTPSVRIRYLYAAFEGFQDTGSSANLTVGYHTSQVLEERTELKYTLTIYTSPTSRWQTDIIGGALSSQRIGTDAMDAALLGQEIRFALPSKRDVLGLYGGLGGEIRKENVSIFASAEYVAASDLSSLVSGRAGVRISF